MPRPCGVALTRSATTCIFAAVPALTATPTPVEDEPVEIVPEKPPSWRRPLLRGAAIWALAHLLYLAVMVLSAMITNKKVGLSQQWLAWQRWDATWFAPIANFGYTGLAPDQVSPATAFFPLFPLLASIANPILPGGVFVATTVVANLAFYGAIVMMLRLFAFESDDLSASRGAWYLVIFPTGFFLAAGYNVSLALFLSVAAVYAIRRQNWWLAGLMGALASANRSSGVLLLLPFGYEYLRVRGFRWRRIRPDVLYGALVPAGLLAYMIYTWVALHDPLRFAHAQSNWKRTLAWPWQSMVEAIRLSVKHPHRFDAFQIHNMLDLTSVVFTLVLLVLCFVGPWRLRPDQYAVPLYGAVVLIFIMIFPNVNPDHPAPLQSATRLVMEVFPAFLLLGRVGARDTIDRGYTMLAASTQGLLLLIFLHGAWVA